MNTKFKLTIVSICILSLILGFSSIAYKEQAVALSNQVEKITNNKVIAAEVDEKEAIHDKMLNSIDYFNSATGSFAYTDTKLGNYVVEYKVKIKDTPSSYVKCIKPDGNIGITVFDGKNHEVYDEKTKQYTSAPKLTRSDDKSKIRAKDRYGTLNNKKAYYYRDDVADMGLASQSLFNQESALGYLEDYTKWDIVGSDEFLGFDTIVIEGTFNDYYSKKYNAVKFKWWVEKNTGILLKEEVIDANGNIVRRLETTTLKLNTDIDNKEFKKDKTSYKPFEKKLSTDVNMEFKKK